MTTLRTRPLRRVERGTFKRSCRRCGWSGTYTTRAMADRSKRVHSCEKHLALRARKAKAEAAEALVDRTPKPCLHKVAEHEHGTRACYVLDRCRCWPCARSNTRAVAALTRQKAYGRYDKYVDAEPIRQHLAALSEFGIGHRRVAELSGVSNGAITKIIYGTYKTTGTGKSAGRNGAGEFVRGPAKRVLRSTAERLLAVRPEAANLRPGQTDAQRSAAAKLQLRALVALGWSQSRLAVRLSVQRGNFAPLITNAGEPIGTGRHGTVLTRRYVDAIDELYAELSMTVPPETTHRARISASRSRKYAAARGWVPPLELEDVTGVEVEGPDFDESAVLRRLDGDRSAPITAADRIEIVRRAFARGWGEPQIKAITGVASASTYRRRGLLTDQTDTQEHTA